MTINPYEPPQGPAIVRPAKSETYLGPWRDGELLVSPVDDSDECSLPTRCVITGVPVKPRQTIYADLAISKSFWTVGNQSLCMNWPISKSARPPTKWAPIVSVLAPVIVVFFWAYVYSHPTVPKYWEVPLGVVFVLATVAIVATLVVDTLLARPFLSIVRVDKGLVWIAGAHANFLAELPPWPGADPK